MATKITNNDFDLPNSEEVELVPIRDLSGLKQSEINQMIHILTSARLIQALETGGEAVSPQLLAQCLRYMQDNKITGKVPASMSEATEALNKYADRAPFKINESA